MKAGQLAYQKIPPESCSDCSMEPSLEHVLLGIIIEVRGPMAGVMKDGKINWYGRSGIKTNIL